MIPKHKRKKVMSTRISTKKESNNIEDSVPEVFMPLTEGLRNTGLLGISGTYNDYIEIINRISSDQDVTLIDLRDKFEEELAVVEENGLDRTPDGKFTERMTTLFYILDMLDNKLNTEKSVEEMPRTQSEQDGLKIFSRFKIVAPEERGNLLIATGCMFSLGKIIVYAVKGGFVTIYDNLETIYESYGKHLGCDIIFIDRAFGDLLVQEDVIN